MEQIKRELRRAIKEYVKGLKAMIEAGEKANADIVDDGVNEIVKRYTRNLDITMEEHALLKAYAIEEFYWERVRKHILYLNGKYSLVK